MKMKNHIISLTIISLLLLIGGTGCEKENNHKSPSQLTGTRWEFAGIVDAKTGIITPLAPKDCYWFTFISETKAQGRSVINVMEVYLTDPPIIGIVTEAWDDQNGDAALFYSIIRTAVRRRHRPDP